MLSTLASCIYLFLSLPFVIVGFVAHAAFDAVMCGSALWARCLDWMND